MFRGRIQACIRTNEIKTSIALAKGLLNAKFYTQENFTFEDFEMRIFVSRRRDRLYVTAGRLLVV